MYSKELWLFVSRGRLGLGLGRGSRRPGVLVSSALPGHLPRARADGEVEARGKGTAGWPACQPRWPIRVPGRERVISKGQREPARLAWIGREGVAVPRSSQSEAAVGRVPQCTRCRGAKASAAHGAAPAPPQLHFEGPSRTLGPGQVLGGFCNPSPQGRIS